MNASNRGFEADITALRLLESAAAESRIVVFCGIPGVGKSLLLREQHALAIRAGRRVSRLQWDVARQAFERPAILVRYPEIEGSTHVMIRRAAGLWLRAAILLWSERHPNPADLLLIEAPLVGGRFIEIAQAIDDGAEAVLRAKETRFYVPTPTQEVRMSIESARREETKANRHARDAANASPRVVDELWQMVISTAHRLGLGTDLIGAPYSPEIYYSVYRTVLQHRAVSSLPIETVIANPRSPHALDAPTDEVFPSTEEAAHLVARAEQEGANAVAERSEHWYLT